MAEQSLKIIHIGGYIRSGTTVIGQILGQLPNFTFVGELKYVWNEGFKQNQLCGCKASFRDCPFWQNVVAHAFNSIDSLDIDEILEFQRSVERVRHIPMLMTDYFLWNTHKARALASYIKLTRQFYGAIARTSGREVIIDSSKDPAYALLLSRLPDVEFSILHVVRDSRGVAFSSLRKKPNFRKVGVQELMDQRGPIQSAFEWCFYNLSCASVRLTRPRPYMIKYARLRYEDFAREPRKWSSKVLTELGLAAGPLEFIQGDRATVGVNHAIDGNPVKFRSGVIEIRPDEEWRTAMDAHYRRLVTVLTWPLLRYYRYT